MNPAPVTVLSTRHPAITLMENDIAITHIEKTPPSYTHINRPLVEYLDL